MSSSVMPSAKYSCDGSPDRFSRGSTARDRMGAAAERVRSPWTIFTIVAAASNRTSTAPTERQPRNREGGMAWAGGSGSGCSAGWLVLIDSVAGEEPLGWDHSTAPTKRYPRRGTVSIQRALSAMSERAARSRCTAELRLWSKSTKVSCDQRRGGGGSPRPPSPPLFFHNKKNTRGGRGVPPASPVRPDFPSRESGSAEVVPPALA